MVSRNLDTLVVFEPNESVVGYTGKMLIHSLGFDDESAATDQQQLAMMRQERKNTIGILEKLGTTVSEFPGWAIHGYGEVSKVFLYDAQTFAEDEERHGLGNNLVLFAAESGLMGSQAWGIRFSKIYHLVPPVVDVIPPEGVAAGSLWNASNPLHLEAFKLATKAEVVELELEDYDEEDDEADSDELDQLEDDE